MDVRQTSDAKGGCAGSGAGCLVNDLSRIRTAPRTTASPLAGARCASPYSGCRARDRQNSFTDRARPPGHPPPLALCAVVPAAGGPLPAGPSASKGCDSHRRRGRRPQAPLGAQSSRRTRVRPRPQTDPGAAAWPSPQGCPRGRAGHLERPEGADPLSSALLLWTDQHERSIARRLAQPVPAVGLGMTGGLQARLGETGGPVELIPCRLRGWPQVPSLGDWGSQVRVLSPRPHRKSLRPGRSSAVPAGEATGSPGTGSSSSSGAGPEGPDSGGLDLHQQPVSQLAAHGDQGGSGLDRPKRLFQIRRRCPCAGCLKFQHGLVRRLDDLVPQLPSVGAR